MSTAHVIVQGDRYFAGETSEGAQFSPHPSDALTYRTPEGAESVVGYLAVLCGCSPANFTVKTWEAA